MSRRRSGNDDTLDLTTDLRIQKTCGAFENALRAGEQPRIEDWLAEAAESDRPLLLGPLLRVELHHRRQCGEALSRDPYQKRFPLYSPVIDNAFAVMQRVDASRHSTVAPNDVTLESPDASAQEENLQELGRGRFVMKGILGRGAFGTVYLAHDEQLDRFVAIKVLRAERFDSEEAIHAFVEEARTAAKLTHPGIVQVYDVGRHTDGRPFIVLEYVDGPPLKNLLSGTRLPFVQTAEILIQVADAVGQAHKHGYYHRDLKPSNILLDSVGRPQVADFGLALHESQQRWKAGEHAGTLAYMAPNKSAVNPIDSMAAPMSGRWE